MGWKLVEIWKDHTYPRGARKGEVHRAAPLWNQEREGYDVYMPDDNKLSASELISSLEELYVSLSKGWRVRCIVPETGDTSILKGKFQARFETSGD